MPRGRHDPGDEQPLAAAGRDALGEDRVRTSVSEIQRARMLAAMTALAAERGAGNVTVAQVVARSGVSRRTFYELFSDREDCFLAAFDDAVARIAAVVVPAYRQPSKWRERMRAGLCAVLEVLDYEPGMGRLVIVETLGSGPEALERRRRVLAQVITAVDEGRREARRSDGPPLLTAEALVGAVLSVIHARMLADDRRPLLELTGPLMSMIVLPYLGPAAARRELARPAPKPSAGPPREAPDPLRELGMRLTYRTVRVLMAVAANPGSSNRMVADEAGIKDQGQVSKLLHRLEGLGLIGNDGVGRPPGGPNAWALTERGAQIERAIRESARRAGGAEADGSASPDRGDSRRR
jgi:AcrR family transcriptional regulator